jgi:hypothetical protein
MPSESPSYRLSLVYRLNRKLQITICSRFLVDRGTDQTSTIYVAGTGRSGTTWLSDLINHRNQYRQIFEPLHPLGPVGSVFPRHLYLRPEDNDPVRLKTARDVLSGQVRGRDVDRFNRRLVSSQRVIKDISSNLFLKWLHDHFPGMPIIFLMRHPCAVLHSQTSVGWQKNLDLMLNQESLVRDYLDPYMAELRGMKYAFEQHIAMWCIENYVPLRQFAPGDIHVTFYEQLCVRPKEELAAIMSFLGKRFDSRILAAAGVASLMAVGHSAIFRGRGLVDSWRSELTDAELSRAMSIVKMFGLDAIYSEDPMPNPAGLASLMVRSIDRRRVDSRAG